MFQEWFVSSGLFFVSTLHPLKFYGIQSCNLFDLHSTPAVGIAQKTQNLLGKRERKEPSGGSIVSVHWGTVLTCVSYSGALCSTGIHMGMIMSILQIQIRNHKVAEHVNCGTEAQSQANFTGLLSHSPLAFLCTCVPIQEPQSTHLPTVATSQGYDSNEISFLTAGTRPRHQSPLTEQKEEGGIFISCTLLPGKLRQLRLLNRSLILQTWGSQPNKLLSPKHVHYNSSQLQNDSYELVMKQFYGWSHHNTRTWIKVSQHEEG